MTKISSFSGSKKGENKSREILGKALLCVKNLGNGLSTQ